MLGETYLEGHERLETQVTRNTGDIGYTMKAFGGPKCLGGSVTVWTNDLDLSPAVSVVGSKTPTTAPKVNIVWTYRGLTARKVEKFSAKFYGNPLICMVATGGLEPPTPAL